MPQCKHVNHREMLATDKRRSNSVDTLTYGYNVVYRRFELCDEGLRPTRPKKKVKRRVRRTEENSY